MTALTIYERLGVQETGCENCSVLIEEIEQLEKTISELRASHDARVTQLLEANNRELERRREAERGLEEEAVKNEREACAHVADECADLDHGPFARFESEFANAASTGAEEVAERIRARQL